MEDQTFDHYRHYVLSGQTAANVDVVEFAKVDLVDANDAPGEFELLLKRGTYEPDDIGIHNK